MMTKINSFLLLTCFFLSACKTDSSSEEDATIENDSSEEDTTIENDSFEETDTDEEPDISDTNEELDVNDPDDPPDCREGLHSIGSSCGADFDRACVFDRDCRIEDREVCVFSADDEARGTCIYTPREALICPGDENCVSAEGDLRVAFGSADITPKGWEFPRVENIEEGHFNGDVTDPSTFCDCGRDMICPTSAEYESCRSFGEYVAPDADGSEEDGHMQGIWIAGFSASRFAMYCDTSLTDSDCEGADCCSSALAHDPLMANAVVFDRGETRIAMVTLDLIGFFYNDVLMIRALLPTDAEIDELIISSTHSHEGPDTYGQWGPTFRSSSVANESGVDPVWMEEVVYNGVIDAVLEAVEALEPADVYVGEVHTGTERLPTRDTRDPWFFNDRLISVFFTKPGLRPEETNAMIGSLVNWHVHPEVLWSDQNQLTSDFPHYVRKYVTEGLVEVDNSFTTLSAIEGTNSPTIYISGTVGGLLNPGSSREILNREGELFNSPTFGRADAFGQQLSQFVLETRQNATQIGEDLFMTSDEFMVPVNNQVLRSASMILDLLNRDLYNWRRSDGYNENLPLLRSTVTQVRIGELTLQTTPGEPFSEMFTGYTPESMWPGTLIGDPQLLTCAEDKMPPQNEEPIGFPCIIAPNNPNPPDLSAAPQNGGLYHRLPGDFHLVVGLGNDALGYLVPSYDYVLGDPEYFEGADGDHYEETNSVSDYLDRVIGIIDTQSSR